MQKKKKKKVCDILMNNGCEEMTLIKLTGR